MAISMKRAAVFCEGLDHPECVAVHPDGSIWAGGEAGQIYRISPDGKRCDQVASTDGFILGIAFSPGAKWLAACDLARKVVWRVDPKSGKVEEFAKGAGKHKFNIANHLVFARDGTLYVTESGHFRQVDGKILRFNSDHSGKGEVWAEGPFNFTNGIALDPNEEAIYTVCTWLPGVERIDIQPDGSAGKRRVHVKLPKVLPDGLAFDKRGGLYVSCYNPARIYKVDRDRGVNLLIDDWEAHTLCNPTNIAFGGPDHKDLFTANLGRWHITKIDLRVEGAKLASHQ